MLSNMSLSFAQGAKPKSTLRELLLAIRFVAADIVGDKHIFMDILD